MFFNPVAEERDYFKERKYTFLGIIGLSLLGALLGSIAFYANWLLWTVVPIFCVLAVILVILKCNVKDDKKENVKAFFNNVRRRKSISLENTEESKPLFT